MRCGNDARFWCAQTVTGWLRPVMVYWLIGWLILVAARVALITIFFSWSGLECGGHSAWLAVYNAIRFDFQILAYIAMPPLVVVLTLFFVRRCCTGIVVGLFRWYYAVMYTLLVILSIIDCGFYNNFGTHINITLFDFTSEAPLTLVRTMWEEYPVVWLVLLLVCVFCGLLLVSVRRLFKCGMARVSVLDCVISLLVCAVCFVCMRGSVTQFPLQVEDLRVSDNNKVNDCVPNAVYMLKKAYKEKKSAMRLLDDSEILALYGFKTEQEARDAYGANLFVVNEPDDTLARQPDVVVMFSESWSGFLTEYMFENFPDEMLCGMQRHLGEDLWFRNFQSVQNGTIASIENLAIAAPFPRVFRSRYRYHRFPTSFATPFSESGYETIFLTGLDREWENVGEGLSNQGFDRVIDKYSILESNPDYRYNSVGIYDHHLMEYLSRVLQEPSSCPRLFLVMTSTNHPPFVFPDDYALPELPVGIDTLPIWNISGNNLDKYLHGFRYANSVMAEFMDSLKSSCRADSTVVLIAGDHNIRTALRYGDEPGTVPEVYRYRVPLYIYMPTQMRARVEATDRVDTGRWGSHWDIMNTLAPLALQPGVTYPNLGNNLLANPGNDMLWYSHNVDKLLADSTDVAVAEAKARARQCLLHLELTRSLRAE